MMEIALVDLCGKLQGVPSNHLLGLQESKAVCGVHVILSDQMDEVAEKRPMGEAGGKGRVYQGEAVRRHPVGL